jgi:hypothetical protein
MMLREYESTVWAKLDKVKDGYDTLAFKKITENIVFKIIVLALILGYFFFTLYGNLSGIRIKDSDSYKVHYHKKTDTYYVVPGKNATQLELFVPLGTESILFSPNLNGKVLDKERFTTEQYEEKGYRIKADEYDFIKIDALKNGESTDNVKIYVVSKERIKNE